MTLAIVIVVTSVILSAILIARLAWEQKDKTYRRENNLPARRYHDITDYDVREVITINYSNDRK